MNYRFRIVVAVLLGNAGVLMCQNSPHGNISRKSDRLLIECSWKPDSISHNQKHYV